MKAAVVLYFVHQKEHLLQLDVVPCYYRYKVRYFYEIICESSFSPLPTSLPKECAFFVKCFHTLANILEKHKAV